MTKLLFNPVKPEDYAGKTAYWASILFAAAVEVRINPEPVTWLLWGAPGVGKSTLAEQLALAIAGHSMAVEHRIGSAVSVEVVRDWQRNACYRPLLGEFTVKVIDEVDGIPLTALTEIRFYLDHMPVHTAIIATTNKAPGELQPQLQGRFEQYEFPAITNEQMSDLLVRRCDIPRHAASAIVTGCKGDIRAALKDARAFMRVMNNQPLERAA